MSNAGLARLVAWALTGEQMISPGYLDETGCEPAQIADALAKMGWDCERISTSRNKALAAGQPWPGVVPTSQRSDIGAAQLLTASRSVAEYLGIGAEVRLRNSSAPLSAHDQVLLNDRPPHHGSVG